MEKLSRRDFIKLGLISGGGIVAGALGLDAFSKRFHLSDYMRGIADNEAGISLMEATETAFRMDRFQDSFDYKPKVDKETLKLFALEVLPMFEYEGITSKVRVPDNLDFTSFLDGEAHNHILGESNCVNYAVLNYRMANPVSSWYQRPDFLSTLTHELVHVQQDGLCLVASSEMIENSAQIGALEVMAGLANQGNKDAIFSLINELRDMSMGVVRLENPQFYEYFRQYLSPDALSKAKYEKAKRFWDGHQKELEEILRKYDKEPLDIIFTAFENGDKIPADKLALPLPNDYLKMDDLHYFLANAEDITKSAIKK